MKKNYLVNLVLMIVLKDILIQLIQGFLKIMSKMGISVLSSYRGGCNFETVGLSRTIVDDYFPGITSKISGIGLTGIEKKFEKFTKKHLKVQILFYQLEEFIDIEKMEKHINIKVN